jgi:hypothetical protein
VVLQPPSVITEPDNTNIANAALSRFQRLQAKSFMSVSPVGSW